MLKRLFIQSVPETEGNCDTLLNTGVSLVSYDNLLILYHVYVNIMPNYRHYMYNSYVHMFITTTSKLDYYVHCLPSVKNIHIIND